MKSSHFKPTWLKHRCVRSNLTLKLSEVVVFCFGSVMASSEGPNPPNELIHLLGGLGSSALYKKLLTRSHDVPDGATFWTGKTGGFSVDSLQLALLRLQRLASCGVRKVLMALMVNWLKPGDLSDAVSSVSELKQVRESMLTPLMLKPCGLRPQPTTSQPGVGPQHRSLSHSHVWKQEAENWVLFKFSSSHFIFDAKKSSVLTLIILKLQTFSWETVLRLICKLCPRGSTKVDATKILYLTDFVKVEASLKANCVFGCAKTRFTSGTNAQIWTDGNLVVKSQRLSQSQRSVSQFWPSHSWHNSNSKHCCQYFQTVAQTLWPYLQASILTFFVLDVP